MTLTQSLHPEHTDSHGSYPQVSYNHLSGKILGPMRSIPTISSRSNIETKADFLVREAENRTDRLEVVIHST